jgi:uncharacterized protein YbjT (DUF2867 family)
MTMARSPVLSAVPGLAVSLYVERGRDTFQSVHVRAAGRVAKLVRQAGVDRLLHISGIGSDARSTSPYIRSRGEGEAAVLHAFPSTTLIRPAVMFAPRDAFVTPLLVMLRQMPAFPMFGAGKTRLQPAYVEDVAEAITRTLRLPLAHQLYELAGPNIYRYDELLSTLAAAVGRFRRALEAGNNGELSYATRRFDNETHRTSPSSTSGILLPTSTRSPT